MTIDVMNCLPRYQIFWFSYRSAKSIPTIARLQIITSIHIYWSCNIYMYYIRLYWRLIRVTITISLISCSLVFSLFNEFRTLEYYRLTWYDWIHSIEFLWDMDHGDLLRRLGLAYTVRVYNSVVQCTYYRVKILLKCTRT